MKLNRFMAPSNGRFRLRDHDPADADGFRGKEEAEQELAKSIGTMRDLQEKLYAQDRWSLLIVLQAMDAAGKDSTIKHVMSGLNPQGCEVHSFKAPSEEELDHDFLWRTTTRLPRRGHIGIFNRSYYEEVLVVRVHPEILSLQKLPGGLVTRRIWDQRYRAINDYERYLSENGTVVRKIFLHASKEEQRRRFLERLEKPEKQWKFSMHDVEERKLWNRYMDAYERAIRATSTEHAPWFVVPADHKSFSRLVVGRIIIDALTSMRLEFPKLTAAQKRELEKVKEALESGD